MKFNETDYFSEAGFFSHLWQRIKRGEPGKTVVNLYKNIRKYTIISGIFRAVTIAVTLFEKSAVLLLFASCFLLTLPLISGAFCVYWIVIFIKMRRMKKEIFEWLIGAERLTVFLTSKHISLRENEYMFLRQARRISSHSSNPVIVVCTNRFLFPRWLSLNYLALNTDCFLLIKHLIFKKFGDKSVFVVL